jgi:hypothetical protein
MPSGILPPGERFLLETTTRVYEQGIDSSTCCAHAVAAAMETFMVTAHIASANEQLIDPMAIFAAGKNMRSLHISCQVVKAGTASPHGLEKATTDFIGAVSPERMVDELRRQVPLMVEIQVGSNFSANAGQAIYRGEGPRVRHAVCLVGYGTHAITAEPYWIAKNSYGSVWGDVGFGYLLWGDSFVEPETKVHALRRVDP